MKLIKAGWLALAAICIAWSGFAWIQRGALSGERNLSPEAYSAEEIMPLHFFISSSSPDALTKPEDDFIGKIIESRFHVKLTMTVMEPGYDYDHKLTALLIANDPPDMWLGIGPDGGAQYALDNALADMTLFISPTTMPNYFNYWIDEKELKEYQFHNKFMRAPIPYDKNSYRAYYIRKDWLDRLGLEIPSAYDEYYKALEAFTYNDPNGNGLNDTYGFTTSGNGSEISTDWPEYVKHGLLYPAYFKDGQLIDMQTDLRIADVVTDILKVIQSGLIEPDWFLNKGADYVDKAVQGKVGIVLGETKDFAYDSNPDSLQTRSRARDPQADWVPFNPFGQQPLRIAPSPQYPFLFSNNTAGLYPEKLKKTAEILDWLAGEEGFLLTHYGLEGIHYTRDGSTITLINSDNKDNQDSYWAAWSFFTPETPQVFGLTVIDDRLTSRDQWIYDTVTGIPIYEGLGTTLTPPLNVNVENMRAKQNEYQVRMLFTDKSGERWPEYRQQIMASDSYRGEEILKHYMDKIRAARRR
ncbi:hypothetical protein [Paenibacillus sp. J2TS4]|uniref:hypothetical protein n=1 Tax=Paenibacillus sp. J2TS4 TaxID=2807194 RepID=UPI001B18B3CE|nr:hypothetical protein [Paenibacillus sp. J2TS4]GIP32642.1 hypothetical protein J2TS4_18520 [Paenibacillus sp. J2TS4]